MVPQGGVGAPSLSRTCTWGVPTPGTLIVTTWRGFRPRARLRAKTLGILGDPGKTRAGDHPPCYGHISRASQRHGHALEFTSSFWAGGRGPRAKAMTS